MTTNSVSEITLDVPLPDNDSKIGAVFVEIENSGEHFVIIPDETSSRTAYRGIENYTAHSDLNRTANRVVANRVQCATSNPPCEGIRLTAHPLNSSGFSTPVNTRANISTAIVANVEPPIPPSYDFSQIQSDHWTQPIQIDVTATPTGSGDLQMTLTWDTTADVDLHVFEPGGYEIAFYSRTSPKGYLDVDDINGYGPENIFYEDGHDAGNYRVEVHHYSGVVPTNYTVTITDNGSTTTYNGTLSASDEKDVVTTISSSGATGTGTTPNTGTNTGTGTGDFCYDNYPSEPCDLLASEGSFSSSSFTTSNTCSGLGYTGATETYDFGSDFGSFGSSTAIGTIGTCSVNF